MSAVGPAVDGSSASPSPGQSISRVPFGQDCSLLEEAGLSGSRKAELGLVLDVTGGFQLSSCIMSEAGSVQGRRSRFYALRKYSTYDMYS